MTDRPSSISVENKDISLACINQLIYSMTRERPTIGKALIGKLALPVSFGTLFYSQVFGSFFFFTSPRGIILLRVLSSRGGFLPSNGFFKLIGFFAVAFRLPISELEQLIARSRTLTLDFFSKIFTSPFFTL
jgi:hypothetical protein